MAYTRDQYGNEVDEQGYLRSAVEEWGAFGIYPPPLAGSPTPERVKRLKESRAAWEAMSPEDQENFVVRAHQLADEWDKKMGVDTRPIQTVFKSL